MTTEIVGGVVWCVGGGGGIVKYEYSRGGAKCHPPNTVLQISTHQQQINGDYYLQTLPIAIVIHKHLTISVA